MACTILSYIIRVLRKKKTRPLSNNNPPSLSPYIYIYPDRFYFIFWVVGYSVSCRCCSARHFLYQRVQFLRQRSVRPGGMRFDTHQPATTPDVKNFVQVDKHFRLFWDILFRWGGIIERQVGRLFLVCHWARHPHLLHHRCCCSDSQR
jgi:hypothetical protein